MGANWFFETEPWSGELAEAFDRAQARVLASEDLEERLPPMEFRQMMAAELGLADSLDERGRPATAHAARWLAAENMGTGTILDFEQASAEPGDGAGGSVTPLDEATLLRLYATTQPTLEEVEEDVDVLAGLGWPRFTAHHFLCWDDDATAPTHVVFCGWSGD
ncbi:MAG: hypothetical protein ACRBI6_16595 [Acidimicrobiales bacterium]